jgi:hypothetical protein
MLDPLFLQVISLSFGVLFLLAAVHKLSTIDKFRVILSEYQLLPQAFVATTAFVLPLLELVLGTSWLFLPQKALIAAGSATLLAFYTFAIAINLARGRIHIGCGCGVAGSSDDDQQLSSGLIIRNSALIIIALVALIPAGTRALWFLDYATLLAALITGVLLYAATNQLLGNGAAIGTWRNKHD